eukprot:TRINITY_DN3839_c0_g1_i3.p1 TRINITY_DN3839_c0_g1~~TRINITY_DN3839_c0_g1_i3.p1  ORF type:complete len:1009 (+),score=126.20 TRINITY_DN3839_c0_g1_i3:174-3200(+)
MSLRTCICSALFTCAVLLGQACANSVPDDDRGETCRRSTAGRQCFTSSQSIDAESAHSFVQSAVRRIHHKTVAIETRQKPPPTFEEAARAAAAAKLQPILATPEPTPSPTPLPTPDSGARPGCTETLKPEHPISSTVEPDGKYPGVLVHPLSSSTGSPTSAEGEGEVDEATSASDGSGDEPPNSQGEPSEHGSPDSGSGDADGAGDHTGSDAHVASTQTTTFAPDEHGHPNETASSGHNELIGDSLEPTETEDGHHQHNSTNGTGHGHQGEHSHSHAYVALLFFFGVLAVGCVIMKVLETYLPALPYTCALFVAGMLASVVHHFKAQNSMATWPTWYNSVDMWQSIDPHLLFFSFLPPLIFGEAMRMNSRLLSTSFWQVFLLACPGVLIGTGMIAVVSKMLLPYHWSWQVSLVFGSVLSATDPVAVVALFNTLGVSARLTMLISGESLLNDGTAIVVFSLMLKMLLGAHPEPADVLQFFGHMTLGAALTGALVAFLSLGLISVCSESYRKSDEMIQVVVTIACGYLAFFIAENELSTSGVLSTVSAGSVIAYFAWPRFVSREVVHVVWEAIEFIGNTIIFFLAGAILARAVLSRSHLLGWTDVLWLLVMYVCVFAIRALMVGILWIPLNLVGTRIDWREAVVVVWSGLRGAVSLALAIIVDLEPAVGEELGTRVLFHVGGIAALTMIINATTAGPLIKWLGLSKSSLMKERMIDHCARTLGQAVSKALLDEVERKQDLRFDGADTGMVQAMVPALQLSGPRQETSAPGAPEVVAARDIALVYREVFLRVVQSRYWSAIEEGVIERNLAVTRILLHSVDEALDNARQRLIDWEVVERELRARAMGRIARTLGLAADSALLGWIPGFHSDYSTDQQELRQIVAALCFQDAHAMARQEVPKYFGAQDVMEIQVQQTVDRESAEQCRRATELLDRLDSRLVELAKSQMLARRLLQMQSSHIEHMSENGVLSASEASQLKEDIDTAMRRISHAPKHKWLAAASRESMASHAVY